MFTDWLYDKLHLEIANLGNYVRQEVKMLHLFLTPYKSKGFVELSLYIFFNAAYMCL